MIKPKLHEEENKRLEALRNSGLLNNQQEDEYNDITHLASFIMKSPVSMISLIDTDKQIFKSKVGLEENETSRDESFCGHAILESGIFEVEDAAKDERFHDNPFVTKRKLRFYAGTQLRTDDGLPLGMLCVMDQKPRKLSEDERNALTALGRQVIAQMKLKEKSKEVAKELEIAKNIQCSMLPKPFETNNSNHKIEIFGSMNCAKEVGGDLYDYFYLDKQHIAFLIGDVSGKGVPAALYMAMTKVLLQAISKSATNIGECIQNVNNLLASENSSSMFITLFMGIINVNTGEIEFVNAGHNQPIYMDKNNNVNQLRVKPNMAIGIMDGFNYTSGRFKLNEGDTLILFTDGLSEAFDINYNFYTEDKIVKFLKDCCNKSLKTINDDLIFDVYKHSNGTIQHDDMTMLLLRFSNNE